MIEILPQSSDTCLGIKFRDKLTAKDYESFLPKLDEAIAAHGKINLLMDVVDFEGWSGLDTVKADFKFGTHQYRQVEQAAFIGDKKRQKWIIKIMDPFTRHTDERFFDPDQLNDAWQWVKEED